MRNTRMPRLTLSLAALLALFGSPVKSADQDVFARPEALQPAIAFWTAVYSEIDSLAGFVHDNRDLGKVYETLRFNWYDSPTLQEQQINTAVERYRSALQSLANGKREDLDQNEQKVLALWGNDVEVATLSTAADNLRFQRGQADRLREGIVRAGAWEQHIYRTLRNAGLPEALAVLPHVESSYNPRVRSHVGAAGLWQFTRFTGRHYMRVDHVIDERLDPLVSTQAAARLLQRYHAKLGSWPLAITAYNHGLSGVRRAVRELGSTDLGDIVQQYQGPRFGFASRNFYAAFIAANDVVSNAEKHFGVLERDVPDDYWIVRLPAYIEVGELVDHLKLDLKSLRSLNPALQEAVWEGSKYAPKGYPLRLPAATASATVKYVLNSVERFAEQVPDYYYTVRAGDTLSGIAQRHKQSVRDLMALNNFSSEHLIRAGDSLRLAIPAVPEKTRIAAMERGGDDVETRQSSASLSEVK
ncbi:MAG: transglycosylase SLT domain-containing protein [Thiogranum sp.]|nr:transglycosylase SLT domain-containing protein [Thiogranum sp.]